MLQFRYTIQYYFLLYFSHAIRALVRTNKSPYAYADFRWLLRLILLFFFLLMSVIWKPTLPRGSETSHKKAPTRDTIKHHPTRSHAPIEGGSFRRDLSHAQARKGFLIIFFEIFLGSWGLPAIPIRPILVFDQIRLLELGLLLFPSYFWWHFLWDLNFLTIRTQ